VTEDLNRRWHEANAGQVLTDVQRQIRHPALGWMAATLDGRVEATGAVFEAKFMLPWAFSEEAAAEKYMPQLQHNMRVGQLVGVTTSSVRQPIITHYICHAARAYAGAHPRRLTRHLGSCARINYY
jgi:hypothetical protein